MLLNINSSFYKLSFGRVVAFAPSIAMLLIICWILAIYIQHALVSPPSFDGAINLNTALSFIEGRGYGFVYDSFFAFPVQTDGPFTLPAGLLMRLGGVRPITTQGINLVYLAGTLSVCFVLLRRMLPSGRQALAGTTLVLLTPYLYFYGTDGYGEIPTFFWFLVSLTILAPQLERDSPSKFRLFAGGIALALCYLTKVVALLLAAPTLGLFVVLFTRRNRGHTGSIAWLGAGIALPIAGWELFRLAELGSFSAYAQWWALQTADVLGQSGATETLSSWGQSLPTKGAKHLQLLSYMLETPRYIVVVFLFVPWLVGAALLIRKWLESDFQRVFCVGVLLIAAGGYFAWWLFITPTHTAWPRRILNGFLLQQILLILAIGALDEAYRRGRRVAIPMRLFGLTLVATLIVAEGFFTGSGDLLLNPPKLDQAQIDQLSVAQVMKELPPDAKIFGFGWWKAPALALFSGRQIMDYYRWKPATIDALPHKYFVLDATAKSYSGKIGTEINDILAATTYHIVVDQPGGTIYALDKVLPYAPFTASDRSSRENGAGFNPVSGPSTAARGLYAAEGASAWARPDSALLLRRDTQTQFSLSIVVPPALLTTAAPGEELSLNITSPGCLNASISLVRPGPQTVTVPLNCPPAPEPVAMEISLHVDGNVPFTQQIDADPRRRAFQFVSAQLQSQL